MDPYTIRTIFLKGIIDESIDLLNLIGVGDVSQLSFAHISELCRRYFQSQDRLIGT